MADVESKSIPHGLPSSHWLKATGQCVLEHTCRRQWIFLSEMQSYSTIFDTTKSNVGNVKGFAEFKSPCINNS